MRKTTKMVAVLAAMSVMVLGAATMVSAAEKSGWVKEGSDWYFYVKDEAVKNQWALSGDQWYFLDDDGKMATDVFIDNSVPEVVDVRDWDPTITAAEVLAGDIYDYYYVGSDGAMATEWKNIKSLDEVSPVEHDGKAWFYFGSNGVMYAHTWVLSGDSWYYIQPNGKMASNSLLVWDNKEYYLKKDGSMVSGWYKTENNNSDVGGKDVWIYANSSGELTSNGWEKINNKWYYFGTDLTLAKTDIETGFTSGSIVSGGAVVVESKFTMESNAFFNIQRVRPDNKGIYGNDNFYLTTSGALETGLFRVAYLTGNTRITNYYFANSNGVLQNGVEAVSGKYYFFDMLSYSRYGDQTGETEKYAVKVLTKGTNGKYEVSDEMLLRDALAADTSATYGNDAQAKVHAGAKDASANVKWEIYKLGTATMWK